MRNFVVLELRRPAKSNSFSFYDSLTRPQQKADRDVDLSWTLMEEDRRDRRDKAKEGEGRVRKSRKSQSGREGKEEDAGT